VVTEGPIYDERAVDDEQLVERVAAGDVGAFSDLYDRHSQRMYAWSAHVLGPERAEDAIQEIFLRLWQHAGQFDRGRGSFGSWFTAIARHLLVHELRRAGMRRRLDAAHDIAELLATVPSGEPQPEEVAGEHESASELARALRLLPDEQRLVLVLAYFGGLSQSQIAEQLALPLGTVKKRIRLGMRKLRAALGPGLAGVPTARDLDGTPGATS
jgi:RNA polymerase sigma-70 factor, ECF subfamily